MRSESEQALLQKAVMRLEDVFGRAKLLAGSTKPGGAQIREDACIEVRDESGRATRFAVAVKGGGSLDVPMLKLRQQGMDRSRAHPLLCVNHVSLAKAEALREAGVSFVDASGNMFIAIPGNYVFVAGRRRYDAKDVQSPDRVFRPAGLKLIQALLRDPEAVNLSHRELADLAGIAHGGVWEQMEGLRRQGFIVRLREGWNRLERPVDLLWKWLDRYAERLRPKILMRRCLCRGSVETLARALRREAGSADQGPFAGGELVAASLFPGEVHPATMAVYLPLPANADEAEAARFGFMKEHDLVPKKDGNVFLFKDFCPAARQPEDPGRATDVLLLAELTVLDDPRLEGLTGRMLESVKQRLELR